MKKKPPSLSERGIARVSCAFYKVSRSTNQRQKSCDFRGRSHLPKFVAPAAFANLNPSQFPSAFYFRFIASKRTICRSDLPFFLFSSSVEEAWNERILTYVHLMGIKKNNKKHPRAIAISRKQKSGFCSVPHGQFSVTNNEIIDTLMYVLKQSRATYFRRRVVAANRILK